LSEHQRESPHSPELRDHLGKSGPHSPKQCDLQRKSGPLEPKLCDLQISLPRVKMKKKKKKMKKSVALVLKQLEGEISMATTASSAWYPYVLSVVFAGENKSDVSTDTRAAIAIAIIAMTHGINKYPMMSFLFYYLFIYYSLSSFNYP
jgi:hypothetical protein